MNFLKGRIVPTLGDLARNLEVDIKEILQVLEDAGSFIEKDKYPVSQGEILHARGRRFKFFVYVPNGYEVIIAAQDNVQRTYEILGTFPDGPRFLEVDDIFVKKLPTIAPFHALHQFEGVIGGAPDKLYYLNCEQFIRDFQAVAYWKRPNYRFYLRKITSTHDASLQEIPLRLENLVPDPLRFSEVHQLLEHSFASPQAFVYSSHSEAMGKLYDTWKALWIDPKNLAEAKLDRWADRVRDHITNNMAPGKFSSKELLNCAPTFIKPDKFYSVRNGTVSWEKRSQRLPRTLQELMRMSTKYWGRNSSEKPKSADVADELSRFTPKFPARNLRNAYRLLDKNLGEPDLSETPPDDPVEPPA